MTGGPDDPHGVDHDHGGTLDDPHDHLAHDRPHADTGGGAHGHGHAHGHSHSHAHPPLQRPTTPLEWGVWITAAVLAVATIVGLVALWPRGEIESRASALGIQTERIRAEVAQVVDGLCTYATDADPRNCRTIDIIPSSGPDAGTQVRLAEYSLDDPFVLDLPPGEKIVVGYEPRTGAYFYADLERRGAIGWLTLLFVAAVFALASWRGFLALGALSMSLLVLLAFIVPAVLHGTSPVLVSVVGASAMAFVALYLTHGVNIMTTVSILGTLAALAVTLVLAVVFFDMASFTGRASEEGAFLPVVAEQIQVRGLLLGGVVIGALGALDDVVITQSATVWELRRLRPELGRREVFASAMRVGREHTGSIINTLLLAYAGASMPLLVLFVLSEQPFGEVVNSELVAVEIVRTLVGSIGLLAAVPLTTFLASLLASPVTDGAPPAGTDQGLHPTPSA